MNEGPYREGRASGHGEANEDAVGAPIRRRRADLVQEEGGKLETTSLLREASL